MTLNITKKKIERVLELFNHPQTRKIRKNRGKKRRRNNKSLNRKNGRKNLATSTLKKKGGHPMLLNGGTIGVVLGGQVGGKRGDVLKTIVSKLTDPLKKKLGLVLSNAENKKKALVAFVKQKLKLTKKTETDNEIEFTNLNDIQDDNFDVTTKNIDDNIDIQGIKDVDIESIEEVDIEGINKIINDSNSNQTIQQSNDQNLEPSTLESPTTGQQEQNSKSDKKVEQPKEDSKNDKMMKLLTLREDYTIFNILNNLLPPKEEGQTADLKEIVKKLDFGKFVDEIGILKNDEEESTNNEEEEEEEGE
jgi:hypothetical protein